MNILVLGANSDVAHAVTRKFAKAEKADIQLASRDIELLRTKAQDLTSRYGVNAETVFFDAADFASHEKFYADLSKKPDGVIVAFGYLGDQKKAQTNFDEAKVIVDINFMGAASVLSVIANAFEKREDGFIIGISSVSGERGRQSNYFYGAAKGAFSIFLSGLRNRLAKKHVRVMTVMPGFVRTKMTDGMDLPQQLTADPDEVANDIYKAFKKKKDILYTKWFWRWIMFVIKAIPEKIFKQMSL